MKQRQSFSVRYHYWFRHEYTDKTMSSHGVPQSCSKLEFFYRLGMNNESECDAALYRQMKVDNIQSHDGMDLSTIVQ